jgi:putative PEP-CTERM system histidine kinase
MDPVWLVPSFLSSLACLFLVGVILLKRSRGPVEKSLVVVIATTGWIQANTALGLLDGDGSFMWQQLVMVGEIVFPVAIYKVGASFISEHYGENTSETTWRFRALCALGMLCAGLLIAPTFISSIGSFELHSIQGKVISLYILVALVIGLAQLEQVLRASRDPLRYQIKFVIIGLGSLAGFAIIQSSQWDLFLQENKGFLFADGLITFFSLILIGFGLGRWHFHDMSRAVSISPQALYTSMTLLIVGGYFIFIGGLGELIRRSNWAMAESIGVLVVFLACIALIVILSSRQVKAELRLLLARHFLGSKYDYRLKWIEVTESFRTCDSVDSILDNCLDLLIRTFGAQHVTTWLLYEADGQFHQVRSANIEPPPPPLPMNHPMHQVVQAREEIIDLSRLDAPDAPEWKPFLQSTEAHLCIPLRTTETLHGFITLSRQFGNRHYRQDDFDLMTSITHYVSVQLTQARLSEERTATAKWEAVSRFSAFYLHDLKTLIAGLSMVAQNAKTHGNDPAFQESAMRTVTNTVTKLTGLINKLSVQTKSVTVEQAESFHTVNINDIILEAIRSLSSSMEEPALSMTPALPPVSIVPDQFKQLFMNLMMNAKQSAGDAGRVRVTTAPNSGAVAITIADSGPGIPESQLRTLFQPFKTTKKDGFGIGLYQCKSIVEQAKGSIRIESQEGQGTHVHIVLPAA